MVRPRTTTAMSMVPYRELASLLLVRVELEEAEAEDEDESLDDLVVELEPVGVPDVVRFDEDVTLEAGFKKGGVVGAEEDAEPDEEEFDPDEEDEEELEDVDPDAEAEEADPEAVAEAEALKLEEVPEVEMSMLSYEPVISP